MEQSRRKEEIGWNGYEEREQSNLRNETTRMAVDSTTVRGGWRDPRAYIYIVYIYLRGTIAACGLPQLRTQPPVPLILQTANNTPRARLFAERNGTLY